jgi:hypothetical protein
MNQENKMTDAAKKTVVEVVFPFTRDIPGLIEDLMPQGEIFVTGTSVVPNATDFVNGLTIPLEQK